MKVSIFANCSRLWKGYEQSMFFFPHQLVDVYQGPGAGLSNSFEEYVANFVRFRNVGCLHLVSNYLN